MASNIYQSTCGEFHNEKHQEPMKHRRTQGY